VRFLSGKWQSVNRWGLVFGFRIRFGLLRGVVGCWLWGTGNTLAVVGCFGYVVGWLVVCGKGVGLVREYKNGNGCKCGAYIRVIQSANVKML